MPYHPRLREIAILPCLPVGLSVEEEMLEKTAQSFSFEYAMPNDMLARMLGLWCGSSSLSRHSCHLEPFVAR